MRPMQMETNVFRHRTFQSNSTINGRVEKRQTTASRSWPLIVARSTCYVTWQRVTWHHDVTAVVAKGLQRIRLMHLKREGGDVTASNKVSGEWSIHRPLVDSSTRVACAAAAAVASLASFQPLYLVITQRIRLPYTLFSVLYRTPPSQG